MPIPVPARASEINADKARDRSGIGDPAAECRSPEIDPFAECRVNGSAVGDAAQKLRSKKVESGFLRLNRAGVGDAPRKSRPSAEVDPAIE